MKEHEQPVLFESPQPPLTIEYELLKGHFRTDGSFKNDEQLRTQYVQLTDGLIHKMVDGVEATDSTTQEKSLERPDVVIWLDKSARPLAWLTKELWPLLSPDAKGETPKMPDFRFVNIDREQWVNTVDPSGSGYMDIDRVDESIIRSLRSVFVAPQHKKEGLTESIDSAPTELNGKTILIVDEVRASGRTLEIAQKFFARAFPDTKIAATHWMGGIVQKEGAIGNADLPVWYKEADVRGRGVGNRDERLSQRSHSRTQRLGSWFLSTHLSTEDQASKQLRREFRRLARDVADHKVLYLPSLDREMDDWDERAERINGMFVQDIIIEKQKMDQVEPNSSRNK